MDRRLGRIDHGRRQRQRDRRLLSGDHLQSDRPCSDAWRSTHRTPSLGTQSGKGPVPPTRPLPPSQAVEPCTAAPPAAGALLLCPPPPNGAPRRPTAGGDLDRAQKRAATQGDGDGVDRNEDGARRDPMVGGAGGRAESTQAAAAAPRPALPVASRQRYRRRAWSTHDCAPVWRRRSTPRRQRSGGRPTSPAARARRPRAVRWARRKKKWAPPPPPARPAPPAGVAAVYRGRPASFGAGAARGLTGWVGGGGGGVRAAGGRRFWSRATRLTSPPHGASAAAPVLAHDPTWGRATPPVAASVPRCPPPPPSLHSSPLLTPPPTRWGGG